jgi:hypothetical protein
MSLCWILGHAWAMLVEHRFHAWHGVWLCVVCGSQVHA